MTLPEYASPPPERVWPAIDSLHPDSAVEMAVPTGLYLSLKPFLDIVMALVLLIPALPLILLCWLAVKLTSRGPGFYTQLRVGRNGRLYRIVKIRTMHYNVESRTGGAKWSTVGDCRVFKIGRFLRKTHLDELPQLFNVLMGQMSLVGPRPERPEIIDSLNLIKQVPGYGNRLLVKPGVTGLAQLQLPADSDILSVRHKIVYDLYYIHHQNPWLALRLLLATAAKAFGVGPKTIRAIFMLPERAQVADVFTARVTVPNTALSGRFQPA
jgi:lipopolysaccharide/colanic/teichoic acid biosynthesis glycosyltransferase